ncbi:glycosyltransferase [Tellurirhabdus rosea]|uniref:glycosyltransferase n=1 Tax=Tellurirhabdus rosea TaxID=2674997 RepID=UPI002259E4F6|nr:glycosyltransferase [Tellurirhabdus rosea]
MPRFARLLAEGMQQRGHTVTCWSPEAFFLNAAKGPAAQKWLGYLDQYVRFPLQVRRRLKQCPDDTLFVFTDHALGPWVPLVADRPHVIHCHDFMAQRSARGEMAENPTALSGRLYQGFIRRGYRAGKNFISVSEVTRTDLHRFLSARPALSRVVYNGLNQPFVPTDAVMARQHLGSRLGLDLTDGYVLHVGGNQWYKNRRGVVEIYNAWRTRSSQRLPLLMIGTAPTTELLEVQEQSRFGDDIVWLNEPEDEAVRLAYAGAAVFLFPSLLEGFGWPVAEAMAAGCPVITTNVAPLTEVAGEAAFLIPVRPKQQAQVPDWAADAAVVLEQVLGLSSWQRGQVVAAGFANAARFDPSHMLDQIEAIYQAIFQEKKNYEHTPGHQQHESEGRRPLPGHPELHVR